MNKPLFLQKNYLYLFGLVVLVVGLPLSLYLTSLSQFILLGSFFIEGNVAEKFRRFTRNRAALLFCGIWLLHLLGLLWTSDVTQGLNDLRIKLPLLILPIVLAGTEPLSKKQFRIVIGFFIAAVLAGSLVSSVILVGLTQRTITDIRDIFIFKISHIRFGLFTCLSIFILLYFTFSRTENLPPAWRWICGLLAFWFLIFLIRAELITGLIIISIIAVVLLIYYAWKRQSAAGKTMLIAAALLIPIVISLYVRSIYLDNFSPKNMVIDENAKTLNGNPYKFDFQNPEMENGYPAYIYMCEEELRPAWNKRSTLIYDSLDEKSQPLKYTLIRFLASKGLRKDSAGVAHLSDDEIKSVEKGIPNVLYQKPSIKVRLMQVLWEFNQYSKGTDPTGHSIMQRLESWKAVLHVIREHPLTGVGTGDLPGEVHRQYALMHSKLQPSHYLRSHNQYLSIAAAFGIFGLIYFLAAIVHPLRTRSNRTFFFSVFLLTALLSMLTEDTLETQSGATFFALFFCFFLFAAPREEKIQD